MQRKHLSFLYTDFTQQIVKCHVWDKDEKTKVVSEKRGKRKGKRKVSSHLGVTWFYNEERVIFLGPFFSFILYLSLSF